MVEAAKDAKAAPVEQSSVREARVAGEMKAWKRRQAERGKG